MAITVPSQTVATNSGDGTDFSVTVPSDVSGGILAGDWIVVIALHCESEDNTWGLPSWADAEWLAELQVGQSPPSVPGVQVFAELCAGGESGTRASTDGTFAGGWNVICFVVRGVDGTTPLDVTVTTAQSTATGEPDPPSITPTNDNCLILAIGGQDDTGAGSGGTQTNYTQLGFVNNNQSTGGNLYASYRILSGGGGSPEDPPAWNSSNNDEWCGATIALRPGTPYEISGVTRDAAGDPLGSCDVYLVKDQGSDVFAYVDYQLSNASTGAFTFTTPDNDPNYQIIAFKDGSPNLMDCTEWTITPATP